MLQAPYQWKRFEGKIPHNAVFAGNLYAVIRAHYANDWVAGKINAKDLKAYIAYNSREVQVNSDIEMLVTAPGATVEWKSCANGEVPVGAVGPFGNDKNFVGRALCPNPENELTPGKVHPSHGSLYIPFDGKELPNQYYEVCVIRPGNTLQRFAGGISHFAKDHGVMINGGFKWEKFEGKISRNALYASNEYVVIRAKQGGQWIPGKLSTKELKAYIPYGSNEVQVTGFEVLTLTTNAEARWVPASNGNVPDKAIGPFGTDQTYIGRAVCPYPENVPTPGKVHPAHKCMYIPFGGKEVGCHNYEVLTIVPTRS